MARNSLVLCSAFLAACASLPGGGGAKQPRVPVAEAERNFAADASKRTVQEAFVTAFAADAYMLLPTPTVALPALNARPFPATFNLLWTPTVTETAAAGDLAVSTGPAQRGQRGEQPNGSGYFLSVWAPRNGEWKVVFDAGTDGPIPVPVAEASRTLSTRKLRPSPTRSDDLEQMKNDVLHVERQLIEDYPTLLRNHAAGDIRLYRDGHMPTANIGEANSRVQGEDDIEWTPQHAFVSRSGDLAYVLGATREKERDGGYIRIYRNQDGVWRVAYDLR
jgi:hypothetical protein